MALSNREKIMSRRVRLLLGIVLVESMLAGLWYMLQPDERGRTQFLSPDGPAEVGRIMGTAMGAMLGLAIFLYFIASAADRRRAVRNGS
jgi:hypothetical protein